MWKLACSERLYDLNITSLFGRGIGRDLRAGAKPDLPRVRSRNGRDVWRVDGRSAEVPRFRECGSEPLTARCTDVRTMAKDLEVGLGAPVGTAAQKCIPVLPVKNI